eukprot:1321430-Karenia_brevis.AAC.1
MSTCQSAQPRDGQEEIKYKHGHAECIIHAAHGSRARLRGVRVQSRDEEANNIAHKITMKSKFKI